MSGQIDRPSDNRAQAVVMVLLATLTFALSDMTSKFLLVTVSPVEASWMRSIVVVIVTVPLAFLRLGARALVTAHPGAQMARGLAVLGSSILFLIGLSHMPLADAVAVNFIWPILVTALSALLLREAVGPRRWAAAAVGFVGVLIIVKPGTSAFQAAALFPLASAAMWALTGVATRRMMVTERPETTLAWSAIVAFVALGLWAPFNWRTPTPYEAGLAFLIGLGSALAHGLFVFAFERARASLLAPFSYMQLVFATVLGVIAFGTIPDGLTLLGAAMIVASGLYTAHRERVRAGLR